MNRQKECVSSASEGTEAKIGRRIFRALGGSASPVVPGMSFDDRDDMRCAGIILLGHVEPAQLAHILARSADPAVPVADFGGNPALRHDYAGRNLADSAQQVQETFLPIWDRLEELAYQDDPTAREELTTLRIAYSRGSITAKFDPTSAHIVEYPVLGKSPNLRHGLEMLSNLDLLRRTHFARSHSCAKCGSARVNAYECCVHCGGGQLEEEHLVHHYRCGCQEPESHFVQGELLICPKCRRGLRHFGVDYDKPGSVAVCADCHLINNDPPISLACLDCSAITPSAKAAATDWYHYGITEEGIRALKEGRLPRFDITPILKGARHAFPPAEFRLLASHEINVSQRSKRPFSVARFSLLNLEEVIRQKGPVATEAGFRRVVAAVLDIVRIGDFIGVGDSGSALIGFPDTTAKDVEIAAERVCKVVRANVSVTVELGVEIAEGDEVAELLSRS